MKLGNYSYKDVEETIFKDWNDNNIYQKVKDKNKGKKKFFFIQGPPYTSGNIHLGQAWNNSLKDMILRYKRMNGLDVFDRAAYDMHGLPTAHKVMAAQNLKTKEEIIEYGLDKFSQACMDFSMEKAGIMTEDLKKIGIWMDFDNACYPVDNSYIGGVWHLIKKADEKKRLYEGLKTINWCSSCQTALAKHECEYKTLNEESIFVKFKVKGKENEYVVIWTTTPWTIPFNLAIMVNPELDYVKAKVGEEVWILAKGLAAPVIQHFTDHTLEVLEEFKGEKLEGLEYVHAWNNKWDHYKELKKDHPKVHTILLSKEYVNLSAGTGLVHCAPGCGPEDYEVGHRNNIPPFNTLLENGKFPESMGEFAGLQAKVDDKKFTDVMEKEGFLIARNDVEHEYAHCARCHNAVIFRTTKQWFFKVEDLKEKMLGANEDVNWVPEEAKNAFRSWLNNLRDNSITKQRFWGTPVPIWKCPDCGKYEVIGSIKELEQKAIGELPKNLHIPWIDDVKLKCECGSEKVRHPDVLDVWIDSGSLSWNILDYPTNPKLFEEMYPADFILEGKDQIRGWFNLLMVSSFIAFDKPAFKNCYMHGFVTDVGGVKMSKSLGNILSPYEVTSKHGADTLRYYLCNTNAGEDINFAWDEAALRNRNLTVMWNVHKYMIDMKTVNNIDVKPISEFKDRLGNEEKYILSKINSITKKATELFESYNLDSIPSVIENGVFELSRTYIQLTRDKSLGKDKDVVLNTIYYCMDRLIKLFSPLTPFIADAMYKNMSEGLSVELKESVHLEDWPKTEENLIDENLETAFENAKACIQGILAAREKAKLGVRWPVANVVIESKKDEVRTAIELLSDVIKTQTNVKEISVVKEFEKVSLIIKADFGKLGPEFGQKSPGIISALAQISTESILQKVETDGVYKVKTDDGVFDITKSHLIIKREIAEPYVEAEFRGHYACLDVTRNAELDAEGYARELMRRIQSLRKNAGLEKQDVIKLALQIPQELMLVKNWADAIKEKVGASNIVIKIDGVSGEHKSVEKIKGYEFVIAFDKQ